MPGDQEEYRIPVTADVSGVISGFGQIETAARDAGESITAGFANAEPAIHDFAEELTRAGMSAEQAAAAMQEWRDATGLAAEANYELATSTQEVIAELDGTAEAARASAAAVAEAAAEQAAAAEAAAEQSAAQSEAMAAGYKEAGGALMAFSRVLLPLVGMSMGASAFRRAEEDVRSLGESIRTTSAELNVGYDQARAFNIAMQSLDVQSGQVAAAIRRLEGDASNGGKQLARLGVSTTDASGAAKSGIQIFEEVAQKINNLADSNQKAEAATTLLGRSGLKLLDDLGRIPATIEEYTAQQEQNSETNSRAVESERELGKALADLKQAWDDDIIAISPAIVGALQYIGGALVEVGQDAQAAVSGLENFAKAAMDAVNAAVEFASKLPLGEGEGSEGGQEGPTVMADRSQGYSPDAEWAGQNENVLPAETVKGKWAPKAGGGRKKRGGGGGADPMAGMDDALVSSQVEMNKLNKEIEQLGSEAAMAGKESTASFKDLQTQAQQDAKVMQDAYKAFQDAVKSGDAEAAKACEKDWKDATKQFQQDWDQAKQKATQDMKQIESAANQISSEVSGILNQAISGKINWQQEFSKILEKILDALLKHLAQQVALWAAHWGQVNALQAAGGAAGLAIQKTQNTAAGTSDAVTAAKGAYASAAQIPYIGWIVAPAAAAAAFAGVEAFGSAEGGWDIPVGVNPIVQAHAGEMVLPASLSSGLKSLIGGGGGAGGPTNINVTSNVNALDSRSISDVIDSAHQSIAKAAAKAHRGGSRFNLG